MFPIQGNQMGHQISWFLPDHRHCRIHRPGHSYFCSVSEKSISVRRYSSEIRPTSLPPFPASFSPGAVTIPCKLFADQIFHKLSHTRTHRIEEWHGELGFAG